MNRLTQILKNIGLSEKESTTYLSNLKVGTNPASVIAKHADLNRCTTYTILESLVKKGLVYQFEKNKIRYYTAVEPQQLTSYIDEIKRDLAHYRETIQTMMPEFEALRHSCQVLPSLKSYSGKASITKIYHEVLKETVISVWAIKSQKKHEFFTRFSPAFLKNNKIINLIRRGKNSIEKINLTSPEQLDELKSCAPIQFICKDRVFLTSITEPYGIEIANLEMVRIFQEQFDTVWRS
jgi:sugar-specific transcriptional regulator TrmB